MKRKEKIFMSYEPEWLQLKHRDKPQLLMRAGKIIEEGINPLRYLNAHAAQFSVKNTYRPDYTQLIKHTVWLIETHPKRS